MATATGVLGPTPSLRRRVTTPWGPTSTVPLIIEPERSGSPFMRPAASRPRSQSATASKRARDLLGVLHCDSGVTGLRALLLGSVQEVEASLNLLAETTETESELADESDDEDDPADEGTGPIASTSTAMLPPVRKRRRSARQAAAERGVLSEFVAHARAYLEHIKAQLPETATLPAMPTMPQMPAMPSLSSLPSMSDLQSLGMSIPSATRLAAFSRSGTTDDPAADVEPWHFSETILRKLERMHELLVHMRSASDTVVAGDNDDRSRVGPSSAPMPSPFERLTSFYAAVPPILPNPPLPAVRAFFKHESIRLSHKLQERAERGRVAAGEALQVVRDEMRRGREYLEEEADRLRQALREGAKRLLRYDELPDDWKNNEHILTGYRFHAIDDWHHILGSLFRWHNETINCWSHLLGAASVVYIMVSILPSTPIASSPRAADAGITLGFLGAALTSLVASTVWHLFSGCGTPHVFSTCAVLDYVGISALISASVISAVHYGLYCEPTLAHGYISFAFACGVCGLVLPWAKWFNERKNKSWRIAFFLSLCASAIAPQMHMAAKYGLLDTMAFFLPMLYSALAYVVGLLFYAFNVPEAFSTRGLFDIVGHSHQFWHCAIVCAIWLHWRAIEHMHAVGTVAYSCAAASSPADMPTEAMWTWGLLSLGSRWQTVWRSS